ncbi:MAG TPA: type II secretion system protein GspK, partial [Candidatus Paceibacterota bacterium]|nr:type II secretion system protein GspK [Candidatus Paceibacterota bacterium]
GVEGNEDDTPFRNPGELINVPGMGPQMVAQMARYFTVRSGTFEVQVEARIGSYRRLYTGLLRRNNPRDIQLLYFTWD